MGNVTGTLQDLKADLKIRAAEVLEFQTDNPNGYFIAASDGKIVIEISPDGVPKMGTLYRRYENPPWPLVFGMDEAYKRADSLPGLFPVPVYSVANRAVKRLNDVEEHLTRSIGVLDRASLGDI